MPDAMVDVWCGHARKGMRGHYYRPQHQHEQIAVVLFETVEPKKARTA